MRRFKLRIKRLFDISASLMLIILLSPLILVLALLIRLKLGRPVFFSQQRLGYQGRPFRLLKFRTMTMERDEEGSLLPDADRMTSFGRFLRSTTLDELPELINVLLGDMSVVGPRPLLVEYKDLYAEEQWRRHEMPPGMAGPVIAYGRNLLSWEEKFSYDVWYVDNWSLFLDLKILMRTITGVVRRDGVSSKDHVTMPKYTGMKDTAEEG